MNDKSEDLILWTFLLKIKNRRFRIVAQISLLVTQEDEGLLRYCAGILCTQFAGSNNWCFYGAYTLANSYFICLHVASAHNRQVYSLVNCYYKYLLIWSSI